MGSSLVKPSQRESRRTGVNDASATKSDARENTGNFDGPKNNGYKVDTLAGPVSNYCKPVSVITPGDSLKTAPKLSNVNLDIKSRSKSTFLSEDKFATQLKFSESSDSKYICPVLLKDFSNSELKEKNAYDQVEKSLPAIGGGDSPKTLHRAGLNQQMPKSRRKRLFPASCIGKQNQKSDSSIDLSKQQEKRDIDLEKQKEKNNVDDQDVSRDARTPSPVFNDFEKVIVTEPTAALPCASVSSPIEKYTHNTDTEIVNQAPSATVSITTSENPAPVHQGELRCELNKKGKTSNAVIANDLKQNQILGKGDLPPNNACSKIEVKNNISLHSDTQGERLLEGGDLLSEKGGKKIKVIHSFEEKTDPRLMSNLSGDVQQLSSNIQNYSSKDCESFLGSKSPNGNYLTKLKQEKGQENKNEIVCANVKLESKSLAEIPGLQGCTTTATKCFCDVNQFDFDNRDNLFQSKETTFLKESLDLMQGIEESDGIENVPGMDEIMGPYQNVDETDIFRSSKLDKDQNLVVLDTTGLNKSETDISCQFRNSRLNCLRPDGGGCALGKVNKEKKQKIEQKCDPRPASWSHINYGEQKDKDESSIRPYSAATGDAMRGYENSTNMAVAMGSTSSSALDVSRSHSNSSVSRRIRSKTSVTNDVSDHTEVNVSREASNKSSRHCLSPLEPKSLHVTHQTSSTCHVQSTTHSNHDFAKSPSSQKIGNEELREDRSLSAKSSRSSVAEPTSKISQHSLPRLRARGSNHNISRSLSNHSSGYNLKHCPRPPSSDSLKHSPRPPSAQSEEGSLRKVRSRPSSVQLSESKSADLKKLSNHSFTHEPTEKISFKQTRDELLHLSTREDDTLSSKYTSQIKLPPILATVNLAQSMESTPSLGQPLRLPPVASAEKLTPSEDMDSLASWRKPCNLRAPTLPPVTARKDLIGDFTTCMDFSYKEDSSFIDRANTTDTPDNLISPLGRIGSSRMEEGTLMHEDVQEADPKPSPNDSQVDCAKLSYSSSLSKSNASDEIARILAKYSTTPHDLKPPEIATANDVSSVTPTSDCLNDINVKPSDKDEIESTKSFDKYPQSMTNFDTRDYGATQKSCSVTPQSDYKLRDDVTLDMKSAADEKDAIDHTNTFQNYNESIKSFDSSVYDYTATGNFTCPVTTNSGTAQETLASLDVKVSSTENNGVESSNNIVADYLENCMASDVCAKDCAAENSFTHRDYTNQEMKFTSIDNSEVGLTRDNIECYIEKTKDFDTYASLLPEQKDATTEHADEQEQMKEDEDKKDRDDLNPDDISTAKLSSSFEQKDEASRNLTTPEQINHDNFEKNNYIVKSSTSGYETTLNSELYSNETFGCQSTLKKYSIGETCVQSCTETERGALPGEKIEVTHGTDPLNATDTTGDNQCDTSQFHHVDTTTNPPESQFASSEYIANLLSRYSTGTTNASKQTADDPIATEDPSENPKNDAMGDCKPSSMFDIESIMAKYPGSKSNDKSNASETSDFALSTGDSISVNNDNVISSHKDDVCPNMPTSMGTESASVEYSSDLTSTLGGGSGEETNLEKVGTFLNDENCNKESPGLKNDQNLCFKCPSNDQMILPKEKDDTPSPDMLKSCTLKEKTEFPMPSSHDENAVVKLNMGIGSSNDNTDYLTNLSQRLSGFGERIADISSLTENLNSGTNENVTEETTVTDVMPVGTTDDTADEAIGMCEDDFQKRLLVKKHGESNVMSDEGFEIAENETEHVSALNTPTAESGDREPDRNIITVEQCTRSSNNEYPPIDKVEPSTEDTNYLQKEKKQSLGESGSGDAHTDCQYKQNTCEDDQSIQTQMENVIHAAKVQIKINDNDEQESQNEPIERYGVSNGYSTFESARDLCSPKFEKEHLESSSIHSSHINNSGQIQCTNAYESNRATDGLGNLDETKPYEKVFKNTEAKAECVQDFLYNEVDNMDAKPVETGSGQVRSNISPSESHSLTSEGNLEPTSTEVLPSERIDTIKHQIYEEGLKPCQRDGGVAFFIPASNTGLQPPVNNPDLGDRLAKPKKPSMNYEERMIMADINRQEQLTKRKEFAVKDLINVKSATTSNSSASGENISGGSQQDRSDRSDSGSLH